MTKQEKINSCREEIEYLNNKLFGFVRDRKRVAYIYEKQLFDDELTKSVVLEDLCLYTKRIERVQKSIIHWNEKLVDVYDEIESEIE